jgi:beta-glucosidase
VTVVPEFAAGGPLGGAPAVGAPTATSPLRYPGVNGQEDYSEGIFVGYRWYDQQRIAPLFPFGYGLSYTSFSYRHLRILPGHHRPLPRVRFTVTNSGSRTVSLDRLSLSYWDSQADRWVTPAGQVAVLVGSSSRNIQLRGTLTIRHEHG